MIHPLAYIHPDAKLGTGVTVSQFSSVDADVVIGDGTWIAPNVTIMSGTRIGKNCRIFPGAVIGAIPQDLKFNGEASTVEIGDNCTIRECVTINRGTVDKMKTAVGNNCLLMAYVHLAHDCILGNNIIIANSVNLAGHVEIADNAILEGLVAVQQFVKIGAHSFVTGSSLVRKNVPPFIKVAREPLQFVGVNTVGLRRRGFSDELIKQIEDIYRILFVRGYNVSNAIEIIEQEIPESTDRDHILQFIRSSEDGIVRGISK
ncbi:MAG: acyl-ACP--UDP-N-acetylglucosamine O-acyltransferase [Bacteroidia bacterium]|nr:acyl-ACP--UDP-N-acetylglucosamine O-acyltransferase [Bacteroidia bacterium]MBP7261202.1 acyl-ACP--UDP-N-acetylglucosamine O-acyltransferase [Bacteroidia bacterium]MBP9180582.1 acyl-ACP--UDP-N-acetylglucosamine O-acyltransferase [Bacteroidia bacterium]MBP9724531.1 acyl-ACP--UDP-N-acetylglucosamine O-acyltransferase [Bacteroidia bacterium]